MRIKKTNEIIEIPIHWIKPNPYQPRKFFDPDILNELADSIKRYGVLQPIHVRKTSDKDYELVAGERRLRASELAKQKTIPAIILTASDHDSAVVALIENLQRQNLNYMEEAEGYYNLMDDYNLTQDELAKLVGKSQSTVANKLRLLKLADPVKKQLIENGLTERHARALLRLPGELLQMKVLKKVIAQSLNVKKTEDLVESYLLEAKSDSALPQKTAVRSNLQDVKVFTTSLKQAVESLKEGGLDVDYKLEAQGDAYRISITIPIK